MGELVKDSRNGVLIEQSVGNFFHQIKETNQKVGELEGRILALESIVSTMEVIIRKKLSKEELPWIL